ncbi:MAG: thioredoxin family protein [Polyangia bacterium]
MRACAWMTLVLLAACGTEKPRGVEMVAAASGGDVPTLVKRELERARRDGRQLLVYVGATWCEPCQRFHRAAAEHKLDKDFPSLRLLEFDDDRDGARLAMAGYGGKYIPLFARPGVDGRGVGRQIEGSIKGDGAVDQIVPRLRSLLTP